MSNSYLRFWGVRGSYAAPFGTHLKVGGNTSCVEIRVGDHLLVCDAGTGIIPLGNELMKQTELREMMVILTHYHWDHISGLPFFVPAFVPDWKIHFFGPGQSANNIEELFANQMKAPYFPVGTETWLADVNYLSAKDRQLNYGPINIKFNNVHHPGSTYGYRITVGSRTIIYVSDNECRFLEKSINQKYQEFTNEEKELFDEMKKEEYQAELDLIKDADILIHDAQYTPEDYELKRGWGHSCYTDTVNLAIDAGVKELYLYHHDPNYDDDAIDALHGKSLEIIAERDSDLKCHIAREGIVIDLD
ncbi:MAG: MBL fold metallo-hydrolase [Thiotrichales bacterium]|nr:MBL fold metallo-hydrolase [Thiotrichales bacterium]